MKSAEQLCTRAVLSLLHTYRCGIENKFIDGKNRSLFNREKHRKTLLEWLHRNDFYDAFSNEEKEIFETRVGSKLKKQIQSQYFIEETIEPLLWCAGLVNKLTAPYRHAERNFGDILYIEHDYSLEKLLGKSKLRDQADIELQRNVSMLWHWRGIEGDNITESDDVKSILQEIFGVELENALEKIPFSKGKYPDFLAGKKLFRQLDAAEIATIQVISMWRQHAYEWILGDEEWDEVETNT